MFQLRLQMAGIATARTTQEYAAMTSLSPFDLFVAALKTDASKKPEPELFTDDGDIIPGQLGRKNGSLMVLRGGNGLQLGASCGKLLEDSTELLLRFSARDLWDSHMHEFAKLLGTFFTEANANPTMLWDFSVCWTDRATAKKTYGVEIASRDVDWKPFPHGAKVPLYFETKPPRYIEIDTEPFKQSWLYPEGEPRTRTRLVKIVKTSETWDGKYLLSSSHRETLGVAVDRWADEGWLMKGLYPGLKAKVHSLRRMRNEQGRLTTVIRPDVEDRVSSEEVIDGQGVLDVFLLRGCRLFKRERLPGHEGIMADELTIALDTLGQVAYVAAACDRFAYLDRHFEETMPGQWLARHMP